MAKKSKLETAKIIITKLKKCGVVVEEIVLNKKWILEANPSFFGCEGSSVVDVDDLIEIEELYFDSLNDE